MFYYNVNDHETGSPLSEAGTGMCGAAGCPAAFTMLTSDAMSKANPLHLDTALASRSVSLGMESESSSLSESSSESDI